MGIQPKSEGESVMGRERERERENFLMMSW